LEIVEKTQDDGFMSFVKSVLSGKGPSDKKFELSPASHVIVPEKRLKPQPLPISKTAFTSSLHDFYPRAHYKKDAQLIIHFLCIYNSEPCVQEQISKLSKDRLMYRDPVTGLDPIQICVMNGRWSLVEAIIKKMGQEGGAALCNATINGWTAAHFAAVTMPDKLEALYQYGASKWKETSMGGTPEDIGVLARTIPPTSLFKQHVVPQRFRAENNMKSSREEL
jgi:hypothetical protein